MEQYGNVNEKNQHANKMKLFSYLSVDYLIEYVCLFVCFLLNSKEKSSMFKASHSAAPVE